MRSRRAPSWSFTTTPTRTTPGVREAVDRARAAKGNRPAACSSGARRERSREARRAGRARPCVSATRGCSMISIRYPSGSRTKHSREPPSRTEYGGFSGSMPCSARLRERRVEVVGGDRDVAVAGADLVGVDAEVVRQLQARHVAVAGLVHEHVDRLVFDRQAPDLLEAERLVEGDRAVDVGDAVAGVDQRHALESRSSRASLSGRLESSRRTGSGSRHGCVARGSSWSERREAGAAYRAVLGRRRSTSTRPIACSRRSRGCSRPAG